MIVVARHKGIQIFYISRVSLIYSNISDGNSQVNLRQTILWVLIDQESICQQMRFLKYDIIEVINSTNKTLPLGLNKGCFDQIRIND